MGKVFLPFVFLMALATEAIAQNENPLFKEANEAYRKGRFSDAISVYEEILHSGLESAEVYYNLGNAYFRNGKLGKAILNYERAAIRNPGDKDIKHNLHYVNQQVKGGLPTLPEFFLLAWIKKWRLLFSSNTYGVIAIITWWFGFSGLALWQLGRSRKKRKWGFITGLSFLALSFLPLVLALSRQALEKDSKSAIVIQHLSSLKSAPDEAGTEIMKVPEGLKISIEDHLGEYSKVRLPDGEDGWLQNGVFEKI